jgi:endonuclease I
MNMKKLILLLLVPMFSVTYGQIPPGYYDDAEGLVGTDLQETLHNIIKDHYDISYSAIWNAFEDTDKKSNGKVWDIYSDVPGGNPPYQFTFFSDQCGNYGGEGDCYNREHSFPRSWFGGTVPPMNTDLYQIYPTDGYVNGKRGNYPYGEVSNPSWTSMNGSKLGNCVAPGYSGTVFEPIDEYKGDLARSYFYMATRYYGEDGSWPGSPMVDGSQPKEWALNMLFEWHQQDPVSQKEIGRNNEIWDIQSNRNPFIDDPFFVNLIWFYTTTNEEILIDEFDFSIFPNPASDKLIVKSTSQQAGKEFKISITDVNGRMVMPLVETSSEQTALEIKDLKNGLYFLHILDTKSHYSICKKLIKE